MTLENAVNIITIFALAIGAVLGVLQIVDTYLDIREKWPKWRKQAGGSSEDP